MQQRVITGLILVIAVIHLLPISGFVGVERIAILYGIEVTDNNLEILMRHRGMLLGMLGAFFAYAAFRPTLQAIAFVMAFASIASFFFLTISVGEFNDSMRKVVIADIIASVALVLAVILFIRNKSTS